MVRYSLKVVEPINLIPSLPKIGFNRFEASITPPEVAPAPMIVWISSINKIAFGIFANSFKIPLSLFSKSPRYLVPANKEPISNEYMMHSCSDGAAVFSTIFFASPSIRAVLPTPDSPTKIGLFFDLLAKICDILSTSLSRPTNGSIRLASAS